LFISPSRAFAAFQVKSGGCRGAKQIFSESRGAAPRCCLNIKKDILFGVHFFFAFKRNIDALAPSGLRFGFLYRTKRSARKIRGITMWKDANNDWVQRLSEQALFNLMLGKISKFSCNII
jgi:hypothetical protein